MKKFAALSIVLAVLAATPALARARHHQQPQQPQQYQPSTYRQVDPGYWRLWDNNNVPFAPF
jgi:hypothetical protein